MHERVLLVKQKVNKSGALERKLMEEKTYQTPCGTIHYWANVSHPDEITLVFLPGLTADHRLFDKAKWLNDILNQDKIVKPVIVGQSMGGYVGQAYAQLYPNRLTGFVSIDSAPLQRNYVTAVELWLLKRMEPVYVHYPWKLLLKSGTEGVAMSDYGRNLMREMMLVYDGDQKRYAQIAGHGFRILAEAMEKNLPYELKCPSLLICGTQDHAGSCIRYNKAWHQKSRIPLKWIEGAGHNSNTDKPELINSLIEEFNTKSSLCCSIFLPLIIS